MTTVKYAVVALLFALGVGLIALGTTSNAEATVWGISLHIRLAKAVGLITVLGSLVTFLVMYGASLPPTRHELERRMGRARQSATGAPKRQHAIRAGDPYVRKAEHDASRPVVSLARTSTEARLILAAEKKKHHDSPPTSADDSNKTTRAERNLHASGVCKIVVQYGDQSRLRKEDAA